MLVVRVKVNKLERNMNRPMELNVWGGDWGLPSVDLHCLEVMVRGNQNIH